MTEYTIDEHGITFAGGVTWQEHDHINVSTTEHGALNYHAEAKCANVPAPVECNPLMVSAAQNIGSGFIPWADIGVEPTACIQWLQFSRANYHYGENGEQPLCLTVPPVIPPVEPPVTPEPPVVPEPPITVDPPVTTEPPVETITPIDCPPNKVPGWLDENGNPQGCVDNNPTPLAPKDETPPATVDPTHVENTVQPVQQAETPAELAETGGADMLLGGAILGIAALAAGAAMLIKSVRRGGTKA